MDKEYSRTIIGLAIKAKPAISTSLQVDDAEFKLIQLFIEFIRTRERGSFVIEVHTHNGKRSALVDLIDKDRVDLNPIK